MGGKLVGRSTCSVHSYPAILNRTPCTNRNDITKRGCRQVRLDQRMRHHPYSGPGSVTVTCHSQTPGVRSRARRMLA